MKKFIVMVILITSVMSITAQDVYRIESYKSVSPGDVSEELDFKSISGIIQVKGVTATFSLHAGESKVIIDPESFGEGEFSDTNGTYKSWNGFFLIGDITTRIYFVIADYPTTTSFILYFQNDDGEFSFDDYIVYSAIYID